MDSEHKYNTRNKSNKKSQNNFVELNINGIQVKTLTGDASNHNKNIKMNLNKINNNRKSNRLHKNINYNDDSSDSDDSDYDESIKYYEEEYLSEDIYEDSGEDSEEEEDEEEKDEEEDEDDEEEDEEEDDLDDEELKELDDEELEDADMSDFIVNDVKCIKNNILKELLIRSLADGVLKNMTEEDGDEYISKKNKRKIKETDETRAKREKSLIIKRRISYDKYFKNLSNDERENVLLLEDTVKNFNKTILPVRYTILYSNLPLSTKSLVLQKIDQYELMDHTDNEYHKLSKWITGIQQIPFGNYIEMPLTPNSEELEINMFLNNSYKVLSDTIYGQLNAKNKIMQIMAQWVSNPSSSGNVIALEGAPGVGKTSLIKDGVSKALNRPFAFIALGGATDGSNLEGHGYTYEGATWGRITEILMETKCMNPIIFFDELDKISDTAKGQEVTGILTHLTDPSQNNSFHDKYFSGIDFDLSKCLIIFSYNDARLINPILRDRLTTIKFDSYKTTDKIRIAQDYMLPTILKDIGLHNLQIKISDDTLKQIINEFAMNESGVRDLQRCLEDILLKINLLRYTDGNDINKIEMPYQLQNLTFPLNITYKMAEKLLKTSFKKEDTPVSVQMMYL